MEKEVYHGDGVITGHGLIRGRKVRSISPKNKDILYFFAPFF